MDDMFKNFFLNNKKRIHPKFKIHDLVRAADLRKVFSKGDTTTWSHKLYEFTEMFIDTLPSYRIDNFPERYNEALLKRTELSMKEKKRCYGSLKYKLNRNDVDHQCLC